MHVMYAPCIGNPTGNPGFLTTSAQQWADAGHLQYCRCSTRACASWCLGQAPCKCRACGPSQPSTWHCPVNACRPTWRYTPYSNPCLLLLYPPPAWACCYRSLTACCRSALLLAPLLSPGSDCIAMAWLETQSVSAQCRVVDNT